MEEEDIWLMKCMNCVRCNNKVNCGSCSACQASLTCEQRRCFSARRLFEEKKEMEVKRNLVKVDEVEKKKRGRKKGSKLIGTTRKEKDEVINTSRPTRQAIADMRRKTMAGVSHERRQCLNPECILEATDESKYCSESCGKLLAKMRLVEVLPSRTKLYFYGSNGTEADIVKRNEHLQADFKFIGISEQRLIKFNQKLYEFIEKLTAVQPVKEDDKGEDNLYESCVVCGQPDVPLKKYAKHVETCWVRSEKAISFISNEASSSAAYCDKYDAKQKGYCKRLKSLCPEHRKPGPEQFLKICGYPLKWENSDYPNMTMAEMIEADDPFGEHGCMMAKNNCMKHVKWVSTLRGSIELEQLGLLNKIYETCGEIQKLRQFKLWMNNVLNDYICPSNINNEELDRKEEMK